MSLSCPQKYACALENGRQAPIFRRFDKFLVTPFFLYVWLSSQSKGPTLLLSGLVCEVVVMLYGASTNFTTNNIPLFSEINTINNLSKQNVFRMTNL